MIFYYSYTHSIIWFIRSSLPINFKKSGFRGQGGHSYAPVVLALERTPHNSIGPSHPNNFVLQRFGKSIDRQMFRCACGHVAFNQCNIFETVKWPSVKGFSVKDVFSVPSNRSIERFTF